MSVYQHFRMDPEEGRRGAERAVRDLLNSPPSSSRGTRRSTTSTSIQPQVTTADLKSKNCWICSEDEVEEEEEEEEEGENVESEQAQSGPSSRPDNSRARSRSTGTGSKQKGSKVDKRHGFVHPCHCTLVAHEKCLLKWIQVERSKATRSPSTPILCPSCKSPIILSNPKPLILTTFEVVDWLISYIIPVGSFATLGGAVLVASTAYGCMAIRLIMGKDGAARILKGDWPIHYYFDIPLIPFALIASRLRFFEKAIAWIPTVLAFPAAHLPLTSNRNSILLNGDSRDWTILGTFNGNQMGLMGMSRRYPPSPAVLALLIPWIRVLYLSAKRRVQRWVLKPFLKKSRSSGSRNRNVNPNGNANGGGEERRRERVIVVGEANHLIDANDIDVPPGIEAVQEGLPEDQEQVQDQPRLENENGFEGGDEEDENRPQTIYVSHQSLGRLCLGALSLPFIANFSGNLLGKFATKSKWLAKFLGMNWQDLVSKKLGSKTSLNGNTRVGKRIGTMFHGGGNDTFGFNNGDGIYEESWVGEFSDLDPVWYRNALGAGLSILFKDAGLLLYKYLQLRQRGRERVKDLPFDKNLIPGLDLRSRR